MSSCGAGVDLRQVERSGRLFPATDSAAMKRDTVSHAESLRALNLYAYAP